MNFNIAVRNRVNSKQDKKAGARGDYITYFTLIIMPVSISVKKQSSLEEMC